MGKLIAFGPTVQVTETEGTGFKAVTTEGGWIARLSPARSGNRLNVFYFRNAINTAKDLEDGIYEVEFNDGNKPHRIAFEVRRGALGWVSSVTMSKKTTMNKIAQALASSPWQANNGEAINKEGN